MCVGPAAKRGAKTDSAAVETAESLHNKRWAVALVLHAHDLRSGRKATSARGTQRQLMPDTSLRANTRRSDLLLADKARLEVAAAEEKARLETTETARAQAALLAELESGGNGADASTSVAGGDDDDALDAFMSGVESQVEKDKVRRRRWFRRRQLVHGCVRDDSS